MQLPIKTRTKNGSEVTLLSFDNRFDRPWVGVIQVKLEDANYQQPYTWLESGRYHSETHETSLDILIPNEVQV